MRISLGGRTKIRDCTHGPLRSSTRHWSAAVSPPPWATSAVGRAAGHRLSDVGTAGFHAFAKQEWLDAFLNASMLLGGMGPVGEFGRAPGKLFAALYALYAGLVFLIVAGLLMAPVFHHVLHRFHVEGTKEP
jgi:hypothetical protein